MRQVARLLQLLRQSGETLVERKMEDYIDTAQFDDLPKPTRHNYVKTIMFSLEPRKAQNVIYVVGIVSQFVQNIKQTLKQPEQIMGTKLRKYIATVSQTAALTEVDVDLLAVILATMSEYTESSTGFTSQRQSLQKLVSCCSLWTQEI